MQYSAAAAASQTAQTNWERDSTTHSQTRGDDAVMI